MAAHSLSSITFNGKELVRYDYDGYGDLTAVYGRDGKKLRGFAYRNHIMVEHNQPDAVVPLRIRPLRHRRQSAQKQQQPRRRMDVRLPQRPYRRYRRIGTEVYGFDENWELR